MSNVINTLFTGQIGVQPNIGRLTTSKTLDDVTTPGFLNPIVAASASSVNNGDIIAITYSNGMGATATAFFVIQIAANGKITLSNQAGEGTVTDILGTENQISIDDTIPTNPIISISTNPTLPGIVTAESYTAQGLAPIPGPGTLTVTNGNDIIIGDSTTFDTIFGPNSGIKIDGIPYTIKVIFGSSTAQLTAPYDGADASGVAYSYDVSFLNLNNVNGTNVLTVNNYGQISYPNLPTVSTTAAITPLSLGGVASGIRMQGDVLQNIIDANSTYTITDSLNNQLFYLIGTSGNATITGNLTLGIGATPGQTFLMPTNSFTTYSPSVVSSNNGTFSNWAFNADSFTWNLNPSNVFLINGQMQTTANASFGFGQDYQFDIINDGIGNTQLNFNDGLANLLYDHNASIYRFSNNIVSNSSQDYAIGLTNDGSGNAQLQMGPDGAPVATFINGQAQINGQFTANGAVQSTYKYALSGTAFDGSSDTGGVAQLLIHNSLGNRQFGLTATENLSVPPDNTRPVARWVMGASTIDFSIVSTDGSTNLPLYFQRDFGSSEFFGFVSIGNDLPSYKLDVQGTDAALHLGTNSGIPATPTDGVVFYSAFDVGLGHTLAFYKDTAGNVTQIGEGSGGGGTVTEVAVTSDLTVDDIPSGSFTVDGTIGLADTTVLATTYNFGDGFFTVDSKGRLTNAFSASNLVTDVTGSGGISSSGGTTPNITLDNTAVTAGTYDFAKVTVDAQGRLTSSIQHGSYDGVNQNLFLNGTGLSAFTGITESTIVGDGADVAANTTVNATAIGIGAKSCTESVSIGMGSGAGTTGHTKMLFAGPNTDATVNSLSNSSAIGSGSRVSQSDTMSYGDTNVSHIFGGDAAQSTVHIVSKATSGTIGSKGVLRFNGINDPDNNWPTSDYFFQQNGEQTDGVVTKTLLSAPISNGLGGCTTTVKFNIGFRTADGSAGGYAIGQTAVGFDGGSSFYFIGGGTGPVVVVPTAVDSAIVLVVIRLVLVPSGGITSLEIQVTGVGGFTINWNGESEVLLTQATINV